jgi:competence protein ComEC
VGFFFLAVWLGALWGHHIGLEYEPTILGLGLIASLVFWRPFRFSAVLLLLSLATAAWTNGRVVQSPVVFDTFSPGTLNGQIERVRCRATRGCQVVLNNASFMEQPLGAPVFLYHPGEVSGSVGQWLSVVVKVESSPSWRNPNGLHPGTVHPRPWHAFSTSKPSFHGLGKAVPLSTRFAHVSPRSRAFLNAIILGDKSGLGVGLRDDFVDTGMAHVLAISGLHMGIVGWGFYRIVLFLMVLRRRTRNIGCPRKWASGWTLAVVWIFTGTIATSPATLRAAIVITCFLVAPLFNRRASALRSLAWAATVLLLHRPDVVFSASFQLSFSAATSLVLVMRRLRLYVEGRELRTLVPFRSYQRGILSLLSLNGVAWLVTTPLCLAFFGQWAPAGLLLNLGLLPLASLLVIPMAFGAVALMTLMPDLTSFLSPLLDHTVSLFLDLVGCWADLLPSSQTDAISHALGSCLTLSVMLLLHRMTLLRGMFMFLSLMWLALSADWKSGTLNVTLLDVGHGDALVVQSPEGGTLLVDSGGSRRVDRRNIALADRTVIPALSRLGATTIDVALVTHSHADHLGAMWRLAQRLTIRELWVGPCATEHPLVRRTAAMVVARGGAVRIVYRGDAVQWAGVRLQVIWPPIDMRRPDGTCRMSLNNASVVTHIQAHGVRFLMMGDLEEEGEAELLDLGDSVTADVLKVGHHGSRTSTSQALLSRTQPRWALISGKLRPGRMPPHWDVLDRLQRARIRTAITGRDGALQLSVDTGSLLSARFGSSRRMMRGRGLPIRTGSTRSGSR